MSVSSSPPLERMWCTRAARAATAPRSSVDSWCIVWPMRPFFWLVIFMVAELASKRTDKEDLRGRILPFLKNTISPTENCFVLVVRFIIPLHLT